MNYMEKSFLVLPLGEDGKPKLPDSLGVYPKDHQALAHAKSLIERDKASKGYFIAEVDVCWKVTRSYKIESYYAHEDKDTRYITKHFITSTVVVIMACLIVFMLVYHDRFQFMAALSQFLKH